MEENIEVKDVQKTEYLDKNGLDMLWAKVKENTHNQVEVERNRAVAKENSIADTKVDKSALANEVTRATGAESGLQAAIETKADALALSNYVLTTALNQQIDTLNAAISAKQDKPDDGNMFLQVKHDSVSGYFKRKGELKFTNDDNDSFYTSISPSGIYCWNENSSTNFLRITSAGITLDGGEGTSGYAFTTNGETARIPTKLSQLANDSNFITADDIDFTPYATIEALTAVEQKVTANTTALEGKQDAGNYIPYTTTNIENIGDTYVIDGKDGITNLGTSRSTSLVNGCLKAYDLDDNNNTIGSVIIDPHAGLYSNAIEINNDSCSFNVDWVELSLTVQSEDSSTTYKSDGVCISEAPQDSIVCAYGGYCTIGNGLKVNLPTVYGINRGAISVDPTYLAKTIDERITTKADKTALTALEEKIAALEARIAALEAKHP